MKRYAALLRGVSPANARMDDLCRAFEAAGFGEVRTVLSSGNVLFGARPAALAALERRAEAALATALGRSFPVMVREVEALRRLLESDPFGPFPLPPGTKRVISFLRAPPAVAPRLPVELDGARILRLEGCEVFTAYRSSPRGPVFMRLLERTFGQGITTRTWDTVTRLSADPGGAGRRG